MKRLLNLRLRSASRRGATVLIAILVFLLAALSGTIALTMATSNAGRYTHEKEDQQAYLAVASAAKLICKKLGTTQVKLTSKLMNDGHLVPRNSKDISQIQFLAVEEGTTEPAEKEISANPVLFFSDQRFNNNVKFIAPYQSDPNYPEELSYQEISFSLDTAERSDMGTVHVELSMVQTKFVFQLWLEQGDHRVYQMTMCVPVTWSNWTKPDVNSEFKCYNSLIWDTKNVQFTFEGTGLTT